MTEHGHNKVFYSEMGQASESARERRTTEQLDGNNEDAPTTFRAFNKNVDAALPSAIPASASDAARKQTPESERFEFEKAKIEQSRILPKEGHEVNDDNIQQLKDEILKKVQEVLMRFERNVAIIRTISAFLLFLSVIEMVSIFIGLMLLSMRSVPAAQSAIWLGSALALCLFHMFLLIRILTITESKAIYEHQVFVRVSFVFMFFCLFTIGFLATVLLGGFEVLTAYLSSQTKETLNLIQWVFLYVMILKVVFQSILAYLEIRQIRHLLKIAGDDISALYSLPALSSADLPPP